ncbi:hypothetical protein [Streptomyces sp. NPDC058086]|uniref:hypothetical protein n=1 Tax=Streptomyces sp. NPDC058086 TaxID=3346334 RepID=UPI0036E14B42
MQLKFLWELFLVPLAEEMAPGVRAALDAFGPDAVGADQQALAGGVMAERLGVPWATSASTSAEFTDVLAGMPRVADWLDGVLRDLRSRIGDPSGTADPRFSLHLVRSSWDRTPDGTGRSAMSAPRSWTVPPDPTSPGTDSTTPIPASS